MKLTTPQPDNSPKNKKIHSFLALLKVTMNELPNEKVDDAIFNIMNIMHQFKQKRVD